jgi:hypothetical protein
MKMVQMRISLTDEENLILIMYKTLHILNTKEEAIREMIGYFRDEVKQLNIK